MAYDQFNIAVNNRGGDYNTPFAAVTGNNDALVTAGTAGTINVAAGELYLRDTQIALTAFANATPTGLVANSSFLVGYRPIYAAPVVQFPTVMSNVNYPNAAEQASIGALHATAKGSAVVAGDHVIVAQGVNGRIYRAVTATTYVLPGAEPAPYSGANDTLTAGVSRSAYYTAGSAGGVTAYRSPRQLEADVANAYAAARLITGVTLFATPVIRTGPYADTPSYTDTVDVVKWTATYSNAEIVDPTLYYARATSLGVAKNEPYSIIRKGIIFPLARVTTTVLTNVVVVNKDLRQVLPKITNPQAI
jgi:hypothetical protein